MGIFKKRVLEEEIEGLGKIYRTEGTPFYKAVRILGKENIITLRDLAYSRIKTGHGSYYSSRPYYVKEGSIYIMHIRDVVLAKAKIFEPLNENILMVPESPTLWNPKQVMREEKGIAKHKLDFHVSNYRIRERTKDKYLVQALEDKCKEPQDRRVFALAWKRDMAIPTNRFGEEELTLWAFKDVANDYGLFLKDYGIEEMPVNLDGVTNIIFSSDVCDQPYVSSDKLNYTSYAQQLMLMTVADESKKGLWEPRKGGIAATKITDFLKDWVLAVGDKD